MTDVELKDAKAELAKLHGGADMDAYIGGLKGVLKAKVLNKDYVYPAKAPLGFVPGCEIIPEGIAGTAGCGSGPQ